MRRLKPLLISTILLFAVCACGQKGPLYLPGNEAPPSGNAEEAQNKEDRDEEDGDKEDGGMMDEAHA